MLFHDDILAGFEKKLPDFQELSVHREIIDQLPIGFILWNHEGRLVFINSTIVTYFGSESSGLLGKSIIDVFSLLFPGQYDNTRLEALLSGKDVPSIVLNTMHLGGFVLPYEVISKPWRNSSGDILGVVTLLRDVHSESNVELWRAHFMCLLKSIGRTVVAIDDKGDITAFNVVAEEMFGIKQQDVLNKPFEQIFSEVSKENHYPLLTLRTGIPQKREVTFCPYTKREGAFLHETVLIHNQMNEVIGTMWFCQDITEQRRYEREVSRADLLAAVSELAAGTAHEIRNPLTTVRGFIQLLAAKNVKDQDYYGLILAELDRANKIIGDFLALAKPRPTDMGLCSINHILEDILLLVEGQANLNCIQVYRDLEKDIPLTCIQPDQIKQVFLNLIRNSLQAMPDGGRLFIRTEVNSPKNTIRVEVRDTGVGILPENISKLFAPFFSTKPDGSGLGLTISNRIIKNHGGDIKVESTDGVGTVFSVYIPVVSSSDTQSESALEKT